MAVVKNVVHGQVTLDDTVTFVNVTLSTAIDTGKSFLVFGVEESENAPEEDWITGRVIDSTTLRFARDTVESGDDDVVIGYHLVEFESGVSVQHGVLSDPVDGANDVSLSTSVNLGRSIALISATGIGGAFGNDEFFRVELPLSDTIRISVEDGNSGPDIAWQVIEFTHSDVQSGSVSFGTGDTEKTVNLSSSVDATQSWLSFSYTSDDGTTTNIGQKLVRGDLSSDGSTLTFQRENSGQAIDLAYFLVTFNDDTAVKRGVAILSTSELSKNVSLSPAVELDHSIPVLGGLFDRMGSSAYSDDDEPGVGSARMELLNNGATLSIKRGMLGSPATAATFDWQIVEFSTDATAGGGGSGSGGGSGTLGRLEQDWVDDSDDLRIRFTEEGQIQVGDFEAGMLSTEDALIEAHRDEGSSLPTRGLHTLGKIASAISSPIAWLVSELELVGTATISSLHSAVRARLTHSSSGDSSNAELRAGDFEVVNQSGSSATPVGTATAVRAGVDNQTDAHLEKASAVLAEIKNATGADIETAVALEVATPVNDGTIDTLIGLDIPDIDQGTENYAIRTGAGLVHLGDTIEVPILTTSPAAANANELRIYFKLNGSSQPELIARASNGTEYKITLS